jgi:Pyruvate/2-oxoacid:ferredoxin oxidoreductase delta subunit
MASRGDPGIVPPHRQPSMSQPLVIVSAAGPPTASTTAAERHAVELCHRLGVDCLAIPHICHIAESSPLWTRLAGCEGKIILLCWIHPRPAEWLLRRHNVKNEELAILNLASFHDAAALEAALVEAVAAGRPRRKKPDADAKGTFERYDEPAGERWYPVMDRSRCVNCQHCLQFCLFGVYELDAEGQVEVRNPDNCKPGCPACSRVCPQSAIMFPLYEKDEAIAGAPGQFVALDAAARKMFYTRTKQPCPVCGAQGDRKSKKASGRLCPECGRPQPAAPAAPAGPAALDDLDKLVDQLDQRMRRRR